MSNLSDTPSSTIVQPYDIIYNIAALHIIGLLGTVGNIFILVVVKKNKELQTPCFILIAGECLVSAFLAAGKFANAAEEAGQFMGTVPVLRTRWLCYLTKSVIVAWSCDASALITMCISIDRLASTLSPMRYRQLGKRYAYGCVLSCYIGALIATLCGFIDEGGPDGNMNEVIMCIIFFSPFTPSYLEFFSGFNFGFSILCIILYGVMLVTFECRRRKMTAALATGDSTSQAFMKQQLACMPIIKLLMAFYLVTAAFPEIGVAVVGSVDEWRVYLPRYYYYASVAKVSTSLAEMFALGLGSRQFRQCAKTMFKKSSGHMTAMSVTGVVGARKSVRGGNLVAMDL